MVIIWIFGVFSWLGNGFVSDEIPSPTESDEISGNANVDSDPIIYPCGISAQNVSEDKDPICCDGLHCAKWFESKDRASVPDFATEVSAEEVEEEER